MSTISTETKLGWDEKTESSCPDNKTCVTYVSDERYLPLVAASLMTMNSSASRTIKVAVFLIDVPSKTKSDLAAFFRDCSLSILWIDLDLEKHFGSLTTLTATLDRIPLATFGRLVINDLLIGFDRHIYLDGDTLILSDISELADTPIDVFGAIDAGFPIEDKQQFFERNHIAPHLGYFNAGVYVLKADYWRSNDVTAQCIALATNKQVFLPLADQDILNLFFGDKCDWLDPRWNFKKERSWSNPKEIPKILHFAGRLKPWDKRDWRAPASIRELYAQLFEAMPNSVQAQVEYLALSDKENRRSKQAAFKRIFSNSARRKCWNPSHDKVLSEYVRTLTSDLDASR